MNGFQLNEGIRNGVFIARGHTSSVVLRAQGYNTMIQAEAKIKVQRYCEQRVRQGLRSVFEAIRNTEHQHMHHPDLQLKR